jgi:hypothetical protein
MQLREESSVRDSLVYTNVCVVYLHSFILSIFWRMYKRLVTLFYTVLVGPNRVDRPHCHVMRWPQPAINSFIKRKNIVYIVLLDKKGGWVGVDALVESPAETCGPLRD